MNINRQGSLHFIQGGKGGQLVLPGQFTATDNEGALSDVARVVAENIYWPGKVVMIMMMLQISFLCQW